MKKTLVIVLALLICTLGACGSDGDVSDTTVPTLQTHPAINPPMEKSATTESIENTATTEVSQQNSPKESTHEDLQKETPSQEDPDPFHAESVETTPPIANYPETKPMGGQSNSKEEGLPTETIPSNTEIIPTEPQATEEPTEEPIEAEPGVMETPISESLETEPMEPEGKIDVGALVFYGNSYAASLGFTVGSNGGPMSYSPSVTGTITSVEHGQRLVREAIDFDYAMIMARDGSVAGYCLFVSISDNGNGTYTIATYYG